MKTIARLTTLVMLLIPAFVAAQSAGQVYSQNVALLSQNLFGGFATGNLTYWKNPATDSTYALVTIDLGLSGNA